jgi:hypothetical protein
MPYSSLAEGLNVEWWIRESSLNDPLAQPAPTNPKCRRIWGMILSCNTNAALVTVLDADSEWYGLLVVLPLRGWIRSATPGRPVPSTDAPDADLKP